MARLEKHWQLNTLKYTQVDVQRSLIIKEDYNKSTVYSSDPLPWLAVEMG